jgi:hypothetical protein
MACCAAWSAMANNKTQRPKPRHLTRALNPQRPRANSNAPPAAGVSPPAIAIHSKASITPAAWFVNRVEQSHRSTTSVDIPIVRQSPGKARSIEAAIRLRRYRIQRIGRAPVSGQQLSIARCQSQLARPPRLILSASCAPWQPTCRTQWCVG